MVGFLKRIRNRSECEVDPGWRPGRRKVGHGPVSVLYRITTTEAQRAARARWVLGDAIASRTAGCEPETDAIRMADGSSEDRKTKACSERRRSHLCVVCSGRTVRTTR